VFVGSSKEGHRIAKSIQVQLDDSCEVEIWSQGIFGLSQGTLEALELALQRFDFAILVLTADDLVTRRGKKRPSARDNVIFELGFFVAGLGHERAFMVYDRSNPPDLPSDLAGISVATFEPHTSGNIEASLGAPCTEILSAIERLGVRNPESFNIDLQAETDSDSKVRTSTVLVHSSNMITLVGQERAKTIHRSRSRRLILFANVGGGFDTGLSLINYATEERNEDLASNVTFVFYPQNGSAFSFVTSVGSPGSGLDDKGVLWPGKTYVVLLSQLLNAAGAGRAFSGFIIVLVEFEKMECTAIVSNFISLSHSIEVRAI
jgi:hypothetical protein